MHEYNCEYTEFVEWKIEIETFNYFKNAIL